MVVIDDGPSISILALRLPLTDPGNSQVPHGMARHVGREQFLNGKSDKQIYECN